MNKAIDPEYINRQIQFSEKTFGPGLRTIGIIQHIRKELVEILNDPTDLVEWCDVIILALDGAWRTGATPQEIIDTIHAKLDRNIKRTWPDWRNASEDVPIEHDRTVPERIGPCDHFVPGDDVTLWAGRCRICRYTKTAHEHPEQAKPVVDVPEFDRDIPAVGEYTDAESF